MPEQQKSDGLGKTPLQNMKDVLQEQIRLHGPDSLSVRMLTAEIARYERDLEKGPQSQGDQYRVRPMK